MTKQSGLGDNLYVAGYDLSGDIGSLSNVHGGNTPIVVTGINQSAIQRLGGLRDGGLTFTSFMDDASGNGAHTRLRTLPTTDVLVSYFRGQSLGNAACACVAKQINYDPTRDNSGSLVFTTEVQANGFGVEWGFQLTPGIRTDVTATSGTGIDLTQGIGTPTSTAFGLQSYLQVFSFTGTSVVIKLQDSADNVTFADITGAAHTSLTGITSERIATGAMQTIRRYIRAVTVGTFTQLSFALMATNNIVAEAF